MNYQITFFCAFRFFPNKKVNVQKNIVIWFFTGQKTVILRRKKCTVWLKFSVLTGGFQYPIQKEKTEWNNIIRAVNYCGLILFFIIFKLERSNYVSGKLYVQLFGFIVLIKLFWWRLWQYYLHFHQIRNYLNPRLLNKLFTKLVSPITRVPFLVHSLSI